MRLRNLLRRRRAPTADAEATLRLFRALHDIGPKHSGRPLTRSGLAAYLGMSHGQDFERLTSAIMVLAFDGLLKPELVAADIDGKVETCIMYRMTPRLISILWDSPNGG